MGSLGIAIDGGRFIRIDSSINGIPRSIRLQTLKPEQKTARLDFCVFRKSGPLVRHSVVLDRLPSNLHDVVELKLQADRRSYALWAVKVWRPDGNAEEYRIRTGMGLWLIFLLLPLILAAFWGIYRVSSVEPPAPEKGIAAVKKTPATPEPNTDTVPEIAGDAGDAGTVTPAAGSSPVFPVQSVVYFEPESALLLPEARNQLDILAKAMPDDLRLEISGHCAFYGTEKGRRELSEERAEAVASYLTNRMPPTVVLTSVAFGGDRPVSRNLDTQDLNRRVELTVVDE